MNSRLKNLESGRRQQPGAHPLSDGEAELVADDRGDEAPDQDGRQVELALVGQDPSGEEQGVAREEEPDEQTGLGEDDEHQPDLAVGAQIVQDLFGIEAERQNRGEQVHDGAG